MRPNLKHSTIYVLETGSTLHVSQQVWLEANGYNVRVCKSSALTWVSQTLTASDVLVLDLNRDEIPAYKILNQLITMSNRPGLILTTDVESPLLQDDVFPGERVEVLRHPVEPAALLGALDRLHLHSRSA